MHKFFSWILAALLVVSSAALNPEVNASGAKARSVPSTRTAMAADDSIAILPKSDVVVVIDVNRLVNDLLPKVKQAWPTQFAKLEKEFTEGLVATAKIDIYKVKTLSIGLKLFGDTATGAMIVEGVPLTAEMTADSRPTSYKGKTLYVEKPQPADAKSTAKGKAAASAKAKPATGNAPAKSSLDNVAGVASNMGASLLKNKTAFVQLDEGRVAVGDESEVKAVIDALLGSPSPDSNVGSELSAALKETSATGLIRFAVTVPDSARQMAAGEDFLKNLAVTKMVLGTLDVSADLSLWLDAKLRTGSAEDATKLHESLAALLGLGKMMLGGNQDPTMQMLNKLLDQIKLSLQTKDVSLGLIVPRELYEILLKPEQKAAPAKNGK